MSLVGLMIKNSIVLLDEIEANQAGGMTPYDATVAAGPVPGSNPGAASLSLARPPAE
jgi:hypothetical protein